MIKGIVRMMSKQQRAAGCRRDVPKNRREYLLHLQFIEFLDTLDSLVESNAYRNQVNEQIIVSLTLRSRKVCMGKE